jgi:hypothetical protein
MDVGKMSFTVMSDALLRGVKLISGVDLPWANEPLASQNL